MEGLRSALCFIDRLALDYLFVNKANAAQDAAVEAAASGQCDCALAGQDGAIVGMHQHGHYRSLWHFVCFTTSTGDI